jgi:hypothetical protein
VRTCAAFSPAEDADAGRQRRRAAERELVADQRTQVDLAVGALRVAADAVRTVVEEAIAVVVAARQHRVGSGAGGVDVEAHDQVPDDLVVERQVQPVTDVVDRGPALERERSRGRHGERTIGVVVHREQRIVQEHRRPLPADARSLERRQQRSGVDVRVDLQLVLP